MPKAKQSKRANAPEWKEVDRIATMQRCAVFECDGTRFRVRMFATGNPPTAVEGHTYSEVERLGILYVNA